MARADPTIGRTAFWAACVALLTCTRLLAAPLTVAVTDRDGDPVAGVAVYVTVAGSSPSQAQPSTTAIMDQVNLRFEPHLLVIQSGTAVDFPNSDVVAHHVYSFSRPNDFALPIYKGNIRPPVVFEHSGVVVLGCNIHDDMIGYIVVVDTPFFAKTDGKGRAMVEIDAAGERDVHIWSPRIRDDDGLETTVAASADSAAFQLVEPLRPNRESQSAALSWSDY